MVRPWVWGRVSPCLLPFFGGVICGGDSQFKEFVVLKNVVYWVWCFVYWNFTEQCAEMSEWCVNTFRWSNLYFFEWPFSSCKEVGIHYEVHVRNLCGTATFFLERKQKRTIKKFFFSIFVTICLMVHNSVRIADTLAYRNAPCFMLLQLALG